MLKLTNQLLIPNRFVVLRAIKIMTLLGPITGQDLVSKPPLQNEKSRSRQKQNIRNWSLSISSPTTQQRGQEWTVRRPG